MPELVLMLPLALFFLLLQRNEIDLDALHLMSENDFAEVGIPKVRGRTLKWLHCA